MLEHTVHCRLLRALEEYDIALSVDPYLLTALWYQSYLYSLTGDFTRAAASLRRAQQLSPQSEYTLMFSVVLNDISGNVPEGRRAREHMLARAPLNPLVQWSNGLGLEIFGKYPEALRAFDDTLRVNSDFFLAHAARARALYRMRRYVEALAASNRALSSREIPAAPYRACQLWFSRPVVQALHAAILGALGRTSEGEKEFRELRLRLEPSAGNACVAYQLARADALAGRNEQSLSWLKRAIDGGCAARAVFRVEPDFEPLRNDARFVELIKAKS